MFTGLVTAIGTVVHATRNGDHLRLDIAAPYPDLVPGESIAVRGACLTVVHADPGQFTVDVVATSLARTDFAALAPGDPVNLERALRVGDRMGGHWVQGHVDAVGEVVAVAGDGHLRQLRIRLPADVAALSIPLGSLTVDGVSLTLNAVDDDTVEVALVPFTLQHTTLGRLAVGDRVHLEGDPVAKHLRALGGPWRRAGGVE